MSAPPPSALATPVLPPRAPLPTRLAWMAVACLGGSMLPLDAVLVNLLLAPWLEELLFREGLQRLLTERLPAGPLPALLTALAFTAAHLALRPDLLSLATFAPACLLGLLYARRQDLTLCICTHSAMNLAWLALIAPALAGSPSLH